MWSACGELWWVWDEIGSVINDGNVANCCKLFNFRKWWRNRILKKEKRLKSSFKYIIKRVSEHTWLKIHNSRSLNLFLRESWKSFIIFSSVNCDETFKLPFPHRFDLIIKGVKKEKLLFCSSACYHRMPKSENLPLNSPLWKLHVKSFSLARSRDVVSVRSFDFEVKHRLFSFRVFPVTNKHSPSYNGNFFALLNYCWKNLFTFGKIFL